MLLFSPTLKTWIKSVNKGFFIGWMGLTSKEDNKYLTPQIPTIMEHMQQTFVSVHLIRFRVCATSGDARFGSAKRDMGTAKQT